MQQLQNASDLRVCARAVLEAVLEVMVTLREKTARRQRADGEACGVTLVHIRALGVLRKRPGATLSMLSDQLALTVSATSRLVDALVEKRLVKRTVPLKDRRTVALKLTPRGARALEGVMREAQDELGASLKRFTEQERKGLEKAMRMLHEVVAGDAGKISRSWH